MSGAAGAGVAAEQDAAYRRIWQTFRTLRQVADGRHDTADWRSRGGVYAVCLIRVPAEALQPELDRCRAALAAFPFVRIHPDGFLHISLQELGFVCDRPSRPDEISPHRLDEFAIAAAAAVGERPSFEVVLGGANSFEDAVFLEVHDGGLCAPLHARLFELAAIPRAPQFAYLPHSTIAHYCAEAPSAHLVAALMPWRTVAFGRFTVDRVEIATLRLDEPYPPFDPFAIIPLHG